MSEIVNPLETVTDIETIDNSNEQEIIQNDISNDVIPPIDSKPKQKVKTFTTIPTNPDETPEVWDIPIDEVDGFLKNPNTPKNIEEVQTFNVNGELYDIPNSKAYDFLKKNKNAVAVNYDFGKKPQAPQQPISIFQDNKQTVTPQQPQTEIKEPKISTKEEIKNSFNLPEDGSLFAKPDSIYENINTTFQTPDGRTINLWDNKFGVSITTPDGITRPFNINTDMQSVPADQKGNLMRFIGIQQNVVKQNNERAKVYYQKLANEGNMTDDEKMQYAKIFGTQYLNNIQGDAYNNLQQSYSDLEKSLPYYIEKGLDTKWDKQKQKQFIQQIQEQDAIRGRTVYANPFDLKTTYETSRGRIRNNVEQLRDVQNKMGDKAKAYEEEIKQTQIRLRELYNMKGDYGADQEMAILSDKLQKTQKNLESVSESYYSIDKSIEKIEYHINKPTKEGANAVWYELKNIDWTNMLTLGYSRPISESPTLQIAKKKASGIPLTDDEEFALNLYQLNEMVKTSIPSTSSGNIIYSLAETIPYMASLALTSGTGTALKIGTEVLLKKTLPKYAMSNSINRAIGATVMATFQGAMLGSTVESAVNATIANPETNLWYNLLKEVPSAALSSMIETRLVPLVSNLSKMTTKEIGSIYAQSLRKSVTGKIDDVVSSTLGSTKELVILNEFVGEFGEEKADQFKSILLGEDSWRNFFSLRNNLETFTVVALMQGGGKISKKGIQGADVLDSRKEYLKSMSQLPEQFKANIITALNQPTQQQQQEAFSKIPLEQVTNIEDRRKIVDFLNAKASYDFTKGALMGKQQLDVAEGTVQQAMEYAQGIENADGNIVLITDKETGKKYISKAFNPETGMHIAIPYDGSEIVALSETTVDIAETIPTIEFAQGIVQNKLEELKLAQQQQEAVQDMEDVQMASDVMQQQGGSYDVGDQVTVNGKQATITGSNDGRGNFMVTIETPDGIGESVIANQSMFDSEVSEQPLPETPTMPEMETVENQEVSQEVAPSGDNANVQADIEAKISEIERLQKEKEEELNEVNTITSSIKDKGNKQIFHFKFKKGAVSFGEIKGDEAYINGAYNESKGVVVRGQKIIENVFNELYNNGVRKIRQRKVLMSSDSKNVFEKLTARGVISIKEESDKEIVYEINKDKLKESLSSISSVQKIKAKYDTQIAEKQAELQALESTQPTDVSTQPQSTNTEATDVSTQPTPEIPRLKDGSPDFDNMQPEMLGVELEKQFGNDRAKSILRNQIKNQREALKRLDKKKAKTINEEAKNDTEKNKVKDNIKRLETSLMGITESTDHTMKKREQPKQKVVSNDIQQIREVYQSSPKVYGRSKQMTLPNGEKVKGRFVLIEAGSAVPSHDPFTFEKTKGFPTTETGTTVNDRDYEKDEKAQGEVILQSQKLDDRAYFNPVMITSDGIVVSGNQRTMTRIRAVQQGTDTDYTTPLREDIDMYGISQEQFDNLNNPQLVFELDETPDYTTDTFAKFNTEDKKSQSTTESAVKVSKTIKPDTISKIGDILDKHETLGDFYSDNQAIAEALTILQTDGVIRGNDVARLVKSDGVGLSDSGKEFFETLLIGSVLNESAIRQIDVEGMRNVKQKIAKAIVPIVNNAKLKEYNLVAEISEAVNIVERARKNKLSVSNYISNGNIFDKNEYSDAGVFFAVLLDNSKESQFRNAIINYNENAILAESGQMDIFSGEVTTKEQIVETLIQNADAETKQIQQKAWDAVKQNRNANAFFATGTTPTGSTDVTDVAETPTSTEATSEVKESVSNTDSTQEVGLINPERENDHEALKGWRESVLPDINNNPDIINLNAFVDKVRKLDPKDAMDKYQIDNGFNYEITISYPHSLGEQGIYTEYYYPEYPTVSEIKKDLLEDYPIQIKKLQGKELPYGGYAMGAKNENIVNELKKALEYNKPTTTQSISPTPETPTETKQRQKEVVADALGIGSQRIAEVETMLNELSDKTKKQAKTTVVRSNADAIVQMKKDKVDTAFIQAFQDVVANGHKPEAIMTNNGLYIVSSNIKDTQRAVEVWFHEQAGHYGIKLIMPDTAQRKAFFTDIYNSVGEANIRKELEEGYDKVTDKAKLGEEYFGRVCEKVVKQTSLNELEQGVWENFLNKLREFISNLLPSAKLSQGQIESIAKASIQNIIEVRQKTDIQARQKNADIEVKADNTNTNPTEAQKEAGNYEKGKVSIQGLKITIENPKGSVRSGTDQEGNEWFVEMNNHYGYFNRTNGKDGDQIDVFIGDNPTSKKVFVVDQVDTETREFDESKVMLGFDTIEDAELNYLLNYEAGWQGLGKITEVDMDTFKTWLNDGKRQLKPFGEYKEFKKETPMFSIAKQDKNLLAIHNISTDGIKKAIKMGGLAQPSIAIINKNNPFTNFGEITLVMDKQTIDPKNRNVNVFGADVYSPRYPATTYTIPSTSIAKINKYGESIKNEKIKDEFTNRIKNDIENNGGDRRLFDNGYLAVAFLDRNNIKFKTEYRKPSTDKRTLSDFKKSKVNKVFDWLNVYKDAELMSELESLYVKDMEYKYQKLPELLQEMKDELKTKDSDKKDNLLRYFYNGAKRDINKKNKIDEYATFTNAKNKIKNSPKLEKEYRKDIESFYDSLNVEERIFKGFTNAGNRRYVPYTLENVLKEKKEEGIRAGENFGYGLPSIRAKATKQFRTLKEISESGKSIVKPEIFAESKKTMQEYLEKISELINPYYKFSRYDDNVLIDEVTALANRGRSESFDQLPEDVKKNVSDFYTALKEMPTEYFEAVISRVVDFSDFSHALVPKGTDVNIIEYLKKQGVNVMEYKKEERHKTLNKVAEESTDILFSIAPESIEDKLSRLTPLQRKQAEQSISEINKQIDENQTAINNLQKEIDKKRKSIDSRISQATQTSMFDEPTKDDYITTIADVFAPDLSQQRRAEVLKPMQKQLQALQTQYNDLVKQRRDKVNQAITQAKSQLEMDFGEPNITYLNNQVQEKGVFDLNTGIGQMDMFASYKGTYDGEKLDVTYMERMLSKQKGMTFMGEGLTGVVKIKSANDVAFLFKNLESASSENAFAVLHKNNGDYKVLYLGTGGTTSTVIDIKPIIAAMDDYDSVTLVHNHPSGNLDASDADRNIHRRLELAMLGIGKKSNMSIIINLDSGKYTIFTGSDISSEKKKDVKGKIKDVDVYSFDRQKLYVPSAEKPLLNNAQKTAEYLSKMKRGSIPKIITLVLDNKLAVNRVVMFDESITQEELVSNLLKEVSKHGEHIILASNKKLNRGLIEQYLGKIGSNLLDVVTIKQDSEITKSEQDIMFSIAPTKEYKPIPKQYYDKLLTRLNKAFPNVSISTDTSEMERVLNEVEGGKQMLSVWHGSPHSFDKFSTEKMGTGEGHQAYGWGLYFTDKKSIAESYAKMDKGDSIFYDGKDITNSSGVWYIKRHLTLDNKVLPTTLERAYQEALEDYEVSSNPTDKYMVAELKSMSEKPELLEVKKNRNLYAVSLHDGKTPDQYDYLRWDKPITEKQLSSIYEIMSNDEKFKNGFNEFKARIPYVMEGEHIYNVLKSLALKNNKGKKNMIFNAQKEASLFLLRAGIDGIKYPTEYLSKGQHEETFNYVVFDENAITIDNKIQFLTTPTGELYGMTHMGKIYLDGNKTNANAPIHEYGHIWADIAQKQYPEVYNHGLELIKGTEYETAVRESGSYKGLSDEQIWNEALITAIGDRGERIVDKAIRNKFVSWLKDLFNNIRMRLGINRVADLSKFDLSKMDLSEFVKRVNLDLLGGVPISYMSSSDIAKRDADKLIIGIKGATRLDEVNEATTRVDNLKVAEEMEKADKSPTEIRLATGWERGADNKWRYEVEDMETTKKFNNLDVQNKAIKLSEAINNTDLFNAYPELKDVKVKVTTSKEYSGEWDKENNIINLSTYIEAKDDYNEKAIDEAFKSVLIHEIQHAIQSIEGFARGGNEKTGIEIGTNNLTNAEYKLNQFVYNNQDKTLSELEKMPEYKKLDNDVKLAKLESEDGNINYLRLAGEVEARNAQSRMNFTPEQRILQTLASTEDISRADQIILHDTVSDTPMFSISNEPPLLAPNGKPSSLNKKQYEQVRTKEFKAWFGDWENDPENASKVIDNNGEPMVVYHTSDAEFSKFDKDKIGKNYTLRHGNGFYFSSGTLGHRQWGSSTKMFFINIRNIRKSSLSFREEAKENGFLNTYDNSVDIASYAKKVGVDGLFTGDSFNKEFIVFSPNQIKSATSNTGTFDPNNPDIRFSIAPKDLEADTKMVTRTKDKVREVMQDRLLSVKMLQDYVVSKGGTLTNATDTKAAVERYSSKVNGRFRIFEMQVLRPLTKFIANIEKTYNLDSYTTRDYLLAKASLARHNAGTDALSEDLNDEWNIEAVKKIITDYEIKVDASDIAELWDKTNTVNDFSMKALKDAGILTKEQYDTIKAKWDYYVPLRGWDLPDEVNKQIELYTEMDKQGIARTGDTTYSKALKKAKGRKSKAYDPISTMSNIAYSTLITAEKNIAEQAMLNFVRQNKSFIEDVAFVKRTWIVVSEDGAKEEEVIERPDQSLFDAGRVKNKRNKDTREFSKYVTPQSQQAKQIEVYENGIKYVIEFKQSGVAEAIRGTNMYKMPKVFDVTLGEATRFLSKNLTGLNPDFIPVNFVRDFGYAMLANYANTNNKISNMSIINEMRQASKAIKAFSWTDNFDETNPLHKDFMNFINNGGATGYVNMQKLEKVKKQIDRDLKVLAGSESKFEKSTRHAKAPFAQATRAIGFLGDMSELIMRYSVYRAGIKAGVSVNESVDMAKNITVNFNRKGRISGVLGGLYAFYNASIQGGNNFATLAYQNKGKMAKVAMSFMAMGALWNIAMTMLMGGNPDDDESYYNVNEFSRYNNLIIPTGGKNYIKIPLPHVFRSFFAMGQIGVEMMTGQKSFTQGILGSMDAILDGLSPVNLDLMALEGEYAGSTFMRTLLPTTVQPMWDLGFNRNFFGQTITRETFDKSTPKSQLGKANVSPVVRTMAETFNAWSGGDKFKSGVVDINPSAIEYLFESYTGGRGRFYLNLVKIGQSVFDKDIVLETRNIPIANRFVGENYGKNWGAELKEMQSAIREDNDLMRKYYKNMDESKDFKQKYEAIVEKYDNDIVWTRGTSRNRPTPNLQAVKILDDHNKQSKLIYEDINSAESQVEKDRLYKVVNGMSKETVKKLRVYKIK